jgi:hypothetical protein
MQTNQWHCSVSSKLIPVGTLPQCAARLGKDIGHKRQKKHTRITDSFQTAKHLMWCPLRVFETSACSEGM